MSVNDLFDMVVEDLMTATERKERCEKEEIGSTNIQPTEISHSLCKGLFGLRPRTSGLALASHRMPAIR